MQSFVYIKQDEEMNSAGKDQEPVSTGAREPWLHIIKDSAFIYAKTGTLSNNCSLSGYLITRKWETAHLSVLTNNYPIGATPVRGRAVERFFIRHPRKY